jgi:hypothetical protein
MSVLAYLDTDDDDNSNNNNNYHNNDDKTVKKADSMVFENGPFSVD